MTAELPVLSAYPSRTFDKIRYGDTDRQGHVNNAVFAVFAETGRCEVLLKPDAPLHDPGCEFVLARLEVDLRAEIHWPGTVEIGTRVLKIGRSSTHMEHAVFQDGILAATAISVVVQTNQTTRKSQPFSDQMRQALEAFA